MNRKIFASLLILFIAGCSAGLPQPEGNRIDIVSHNAAYCREDFRSCAIDIINNIIENTEKSKLENIPFHEKSKLTQNTSELKIGGGFFKEAVRFNAKRFYIDVQEKEAVLYSLLLTKNNKYVHFTGRFKFIETQPDYYLISELEVISALSSSKESCYSDDEPFKRVDPTIQLNRKELISIVNKYFDGIENTSSEGIPFHENVIRTENCITMSYGRLMQKLQMNTLFASIPRVRERHLIADPEKGVVIGNIVFDHAIGPLELMSTPMSERFQFDGDKIRYIEAVFPTDTYGKPSGWERRCR